MRRTTRAVLRSRACPKCDRRFASERGLAQHDGKAHPYVQPPAPRETTFKACLEVESHSLIGGKNFHLGDVVWFGRKAVITKITTVDGSSDAKVEVMITRKWYSAEELVSNS